MTDDGHGADCWCPAYCEGSPHCPPRCPRFFDRNGDAWLVRPFEAGDREPLLETYRDFAPAERAMGLPPATDDRLADWLDGLRSEGCNFVAVRDGVVAGHAAYTPADAAEPELAVFVHQDYQRRGIGTELCRHVVAAAAAADRDALVLDVERSNRAAIRVYERLGFEPTSGGLDDGPGRSRSLRMRLALPGVTAESVRQPPALAD